jgi:S-DNA-T family DNA segregation ATPase FtsK/SpoIIIE
MAKKTNKPKTNSPKQKAKSKSISKMPKPSLDFIQSDKFKLSLGIFFLFLSIYLAFAFISYLVHWTADYDKIFTFEWSDLNGSVQLENYGGFIGAWISHFFIYKMFGLTSILFVLLFFLIGSKLTFRIQFLPFLKTLKISFIIMLWSSVFFGSIFRESAWTILGGTFGYQTSKWIESVAGVVGLITLLSFALLAFLIVHFNFIMIYFKKWQQQSSHKSNKSSSIQTDENSDKYNTEEYAVDDDQESTNQSKTNHIKTDETTDHIQEDISDNISITEIENEIVEGEIELKTDQPEPTKTKKNSEEDFDLELTTTHEISESPKPETNIQSNDGIQEVQVEGVSDSMKVEIGREEQSSENRSHSIDTPYDPTEDLSDFKFPEIDLLESHGSDKINIFKEELEANKNKIVNTLNHYNIKIQKIKATVGPTVTLYEIVPAPGVRISKIRNLEDDIALSLSALGIRIIAPIPGKGSIGIEVPNSKPEIVPMRAVIQSKVFQDSKYELPVVIGKTISNESFAFDLAKMPHLLMAGATGQGKSVGLNAIIASLLYKKHPAQLKFVMVDPKKVELTLFSKIERHYLAKLPDSEEAIITDTQSVVHTLYSLVNEMDHRYDLLKDAQVRNIKEYNAKFIARRLNPNNGHKYMPYIVLIVDEFADLMMTAGKEVEGPIARLAQLARAIGIHLIIATQRPSVNVITGIIKANFPARIAFRVTSRIDSRTILDAGGADQLIGRGDMLFSTGNDMTRLQCAFIDTPEVDDITEFIGSQRGYTSAYILPEANTDTGEQDSAIEIADRDELFEDAARVIVNAQQGSTSLIQRKLKLGYNRAGRIIDQLEAAGIVGPFEGSKAREVRVANEMALEQFLKDLYAKEQE